MRRLALLLPLCAACGDDGSAKPTDAAVDVPIDMPADAMLDAPPPIPGFHHYVMDTLRVPGNNTEARDFGLDLDGNGTIDNQLGMVTGTLSGMGFEVQAATTAQIDHGQVLELFRLFAQTFTSEPVATFTAYVGANPNPAACAGASDTVCRRHLTGSGTFSIAAASPMTQPLGGTLTNGSMTTQPGHLVVPVTVFTGASTPLYLTLVGAKVQVTMASDAKLMQLKLTGGVTQTDIDGKLIPAIRDGAQAQVMKDCTMPGSPPTCGCAAGSSGKTMLDLFDGDVAGTQKDCTVSEAEVRGSSLIQALLAPDVMLEGQMCLSYGVRASAVAAGFVAP